MSQVRRKGRPEKSLVAAFKVMAWFNAVSLTSGLSAYQLEREFGQPRSFRTNGRGDSVRPCLWDKYRRGEVLPNNGNHQNGKKGIVQRVEEEYPGTAKWLALPLWKVADTTPMAMEEIRGVYESLSEDVKNLILSTRSVGNNLFWRKESDSSELYAALIDIGTLDAATAVMALIKEAEVAQNQVQHAGGLPALWECTKKLLSHSIVGPLMEMFCFHIAEQYFFPVVYVIDETEGYQYYVDPKKRSIGSRRIVLGGTEPDP